MLTTSTLRSLCGEVVSNESVQPKPTDGAGRYIGRRKLHFPRIDSTNEFAASLADDIANDGVVVIADEQTAGRGQYGRSWRAPARTSILMSVVLFPPAELRRPALLTAWAAVAVCETIRHLTQEDAVIKWPNDVLLGGKKVCGILIEQGKAIIAGIGLNVAQSREMFAELPHAGSLYSATGRLFDPAVVTDRLISELDISYERLLRLELQTLETTWKERLGLVARSVLLEEGEGRRHRGLLRDLTFSAVELIDPEGRRHRYRPEAVRQLSLDTASTRETGPGGALNS